MRFRYWFSLFETVFSVTYGLGLGGTVEGRDITVVDIVLKSARLRFLEAYEVSIVIE